MSSPVRKPAPALAGPPPQGLREANLARVLRAVVASPEPVSRAEVATRTAVTRATASRLVDDLLQRGLVTELEPVTSAGPGRPGTPLVPSAGRVAALGLQVDVGRLAALVVDLRGEVLARRIEEADLRGSRPATVLARLSRLAGATWTESRATTLAGSRLALPGIVAEQRRLLRAPNLGWTDVDVAAVLATASEAAPWPPGSLRVGNEADLASATVSLARPGVPGRLRDFIYLSGEIGVGGAVVVDGAPLPGRHGWAGEIGHVTVDPDGPPCACGSTGCLEQYAGRRALMAAAGLPPEARPADLLDRVAAGDPAATAALDRAAVALGTALSATVNVVDVPVVVLGGHLRELGEVARARIESTMGERVLSSAWVPPQVEPAPDLPVPGALGAAYRELEELLDHPAHRVAAAGERP